MKAGAHHVPRGPDDAGGGTTRVQRWSDEEWGPVDDEPLPDTRSGARRLALEALYWESTAPGQLEQALKQRSGAAHMRAANIAFARHLARTCVERADEIQAIVAATARNWSPERIARVDGLILRLALAELLFHDEVPPRVTIDEAVELAKEYGGDKSHAFVNGVLDAVARQRGLV